MSGRADWLLDIGHSRVKWGRGPAGALTCTGACPVGHLQDLNDVLTKAPSSTAWLSGQSNRDSVTAITTLLADHGVSLQPVRTGELNLPIPPAYPTLGSDRWLALQWPWTRRTSAFCVVDCGTAVTIDVVDRHGRHLGGWILAGLGVLRAGLLEKARGLPSPGPTDADSALSGSPATDSAAAIARGTLLQLIGGIEHALTRARHALDDRPAIWLTGGDALAVRDALGSDIHHDPHLVLRGLALASVQP